MAHEPVQHRSSRTTRFVRQVGRIALLAHAVIASLPRIRQWWAPFMVETRRQILGTLPLAAFLSALGGAVTSQQSGYQFTGYLPHG